MNEQFQVTYTLNTNGSNFRGPALGDFSVLAGPMTMNNTQIVNGSVSISQSYTYMLMPKAEGSFKIGPATVAANGQTITSNVVNITVVKGNSSAQNNRGQAGGSQDDGNAISERNLFIRASVDKSSAYLGEGISITFKLYSNVDLSSPAIKSIPSFTGFWNHEVELSTSDQSLRSQENVNGINYNSWVLKKFVLFPQQSGTITIDPMELEGIARLKGKGRREDVDPFGMFGNDPFGQQMMQMMGGYKDVKYVIKTNVLKINVRPLPPNAPASFSGAVGKMSVDVQLDKTTAKANEPLSLKLKINGSGNLKLAEAPEINFPPDFETYDPKITENYKVSASTVSGTKTIEYLIMPRHEGNFTIDPIAFTYFDLEKNQYVTHHAGPFNVHVTRGSGSGAATASGGGIDKSDFQLLGRDIRYIKITTSDFTLDNGHFYGSAPFYALSIAPLLLFGGLIVYRRKQDQYLSDKSLLRSRNATSIAKKRLSTADKLLQSGKHSEVFDEVSKALWGYVSDKLTIPLSELSKETIAAMLTGKQVSENSVSTFLSTLQSCEMARYAGFTAGDAGAIYKQALELISKIEGELKA